jgi:hypothetical protein
MPQTVIRVFRTASGTIPLKDWLEGLEQTGSRAYAKCLERIELLTKLGNELRRPLADMLRDGIHELRMKVGTVNYRILYFFCGSHVICLSHGFTKKGEVPDAEIETAIKRRELVKKDIGKYTVVDWRE